MSNANEIKQKKDKDLTVEICNVTVTGELENKITDLNKFMEDGKWLETCHWKHYGRVQEIQNLTMKLTGSVTPDSGLWVGDKIRWIPGKITKGLCVKNNPNWPHADSTWNGCYRVFTSDKKQIGIVSKNTGQSIWEE